MSDSFAATATAPWVVDAILEELSGRKGLDIMEIVQDRGIYNEIKYALADIVENGILNASDDASVGGEPASFKWDREARAWVEVEPEEEEPLYSWL